MCGKVRVGTSVCLCRGNST